MTPQPFRLASGGVIDRKRTLRFTFAGKSYTGYPGDTLAAALLANGERLVGRSFKYHRPRGIVSAGSEEPNALVEMRTGARREPNTRATMVELYDGLDAASQNRWPSLKFDVQSVNGLLSPFFSAGFYYKTFMWPAKFWKLVYEPLIRRSAGLGRAATDPDPDHYERAFAHCDVIVIGSGPAGLMAALTAGRAGARVILAEEDFMFGGRLLSDRLTVDGKPAREWLHGTLAELRSLDTVRLMPRTTIFGVYDGGIYGAVERVADHVPVPPEHRPRQRSWRIVAKRAVLASGAIERGIAFAGNDLPGVMQGSAVRSYLNRFGVAPGGRAVVFTASDDGWATARDLVASGVAVAAVVDPRKDGIETRAVGPWPVFLGAEVKQTKGGHQLRSVIVRDDKGGETEIACDLLAVSNGWNPTLHLTCHLGGKPVWHEALNAFVPGSVPSGVAVAGAAAGHLTLAKALPDGTRLGAAAASDLGFAGSVPPMPPVGGEETALATPLWRVQGGKGPAFVDIQNDVTTKDIELALQEGYGASEHVKRYTTLGMGTDQGKTANVTALGVLSELTGQAIPAFGTTGFRPPYTPVTWGALAGHHRGKDFRPKRLPPSHAWAEENGAVFADAGLWLRAQWYQRPGETLQQSIAREAAAVRRSVGVCDVSTLGKIDIQGPDAPTLLDRVYTNKFSTLKVGRARYGLMLREDGFAMDDGTTARLGEQHFIMTTTTANAGKVMQHLELCRQVLWPELDVRLVSVSDHWAQYAVAGPRSREVLAKLVGAPFDISDEGFPRMAAGELTICGGVPARLFRVSFSGEMAYEIAVPACYGDAAIRALMQAGAEFDITPYGTEALNVLRIEKGHVGGAEINGQTTARDLGLAGMVSADKDCIGKVLAGRPALLDPARPILVGVKPIDPANSLTAGSHFIPVGAEPVTANDEGYLTSVAFSPVLGQDIGIGFLARGRERLGERIRAVDLLRGHDVECVVASPIFYDTEGKLTHG
ncbi:MAG: sarcosine oxidase subunit alpha family protein [Methyloceanibacter sp.]